MGNNSDEGESSVGGIVAGVAVAAVAVAGIAGLLYSVFNSRAEREAESERRVNAERVEREEAARLKREEAEWSRLMETERLKRMEAERLRREEADSLKRMEAERLRREKAEMLKREEAERLKREEADRLRRMEAEILKRMEAERLKREAAERFTREESERQARRERVERLMREEADRLKQENADRLKREEVEGLKREEAERLKQEEAVRLEREKAQKEVEIRTKQEAFERQTRQEQEAKKQSEERALQEEVIKQAHLMATKGAQEIARNEYDANNHAKGPAGQETVKKHAGEQVSQYATVKKSKRRARKRASKKRATQGVFDEKTGNSAGQEETEDVISLIKKGIQFFKEGWEAEKKEQSEEAEFKFQNAHEKFDVACKADPNNAQSRDGREISSLKIKGNRLFNEGVKLQQRANDSDESKECYEAAREMFKDAKRAFEEGWRKSKDKGFQESMSIADECMKAAGDLVNLVRQVQAEKNEAEIRTEIDEDGNHITVIEKKQL